jgi:hypothetical protein
MAGSGDWVVLTLFWVGTNQVWKGGKKGVKNERPG